MLDPVYAGKVMAVLIDALRVDSLRPEETGLFLHTDGLPVIFALSPQLWQMQSNTGH